MSFSPSNLSLTQRERFALLHAGLLVIASSWLFGGMGPHGEWIVAALAAPAFGLLAAEGLARRKQGDLDGVKRMARWLAPLLAFAGLVVISVLNPSHRVAVVNQTELLRPVPHVAWLPSSADPAGSLHALACLAGLAATGLSLAFCVHSRRALRLLLLVLAGNALALSVLGTLQLQSGANGPYFGAVTAANEKWFATFHYYNHWGAFAALHAAATLALVFHSLRHAPARGWLYGPGPLLALGSLLIAATAPLSASRSATVLMAALAVAALLASLRQVSRSPRKTHARRATTRLSSRGLIGIFALLALAAGLVFFQSRKIVEHRYEQTVAELAGFIVGDKGYGRSSLYADTWRMIADRPVFGWGLESYGAVFLGYSTVRTDSAGVTNTYEDAHSDWLQSLAETGFVGTLLLVAFALWPLAETLRASHAGALAGWLLGGCVLLAAYAWLEFPFACPAVVATWWILFFAALRTIQLSPSRKAGHLSAEPCSPSSS